MTKLQQIYDSMQHLSKEELAELIAYARALKKKARPLSGLHAECKTAFVELYKKWYSTRYYFTAKDAQSLKLLLKKIEAKLKEQNTVIDDKIMAQSFELFITKIYNLNDAWLRDHFTLAIINSQFNSIYLRFKHPVNGNVSSSYKERVLRDLQNGN